MFNCTINYVVIKINGDYAVLKNIDKQNETLLVAMALLPQGIDEGTKLIWKDLEYTIVE